MTLRTWLVLFIISMAVNAEVIAWALRHGQFSHVNRGRWMPLRHPDQAAATPPANSPLRRWRLAAVLFGLTVMTLAWVSGMAILLRESFGH